MCLNPILIKNVNHSPTLYRRGKNGKMKIAIQKTKWTKSMKDDCAYIYVPCGKCPQCIAFRQSNYTQRLEMEAINHHLFFATLTYKPSMLPIHITSTGYRLPYPNCKHVQDMFKRLRKIDAFGRPFKYMYINELGSKAGRPHFHIIFILSKYPDDDALEIINLTQRMKKALMNEWRVNLGSRRKPIYEPLCEFITLRRNGKISTTFDFKYIEPRDSKNGVIDVGQYVCKYMVKAFDTNDKGKKKKNYYNRICSKIKLTYPEDEAQKLINLITPRVRKSLEFGAIDDADVIRKIRRDIDNSITEDLPKFQYLSGKSAPLCRYYRGKFYKADMEVMRARKKTHNVHWREGDKYFQTVEHNFTESQLSINHKKQKILSLLEDRDFTTNL